MHAPMKGLALAAPLMLPLSAGVAAGSTAFVMALASAALGAEIPAWHKAAPGTEAFLGDDGGGSDTATVCDTVDHYRAWINDEDHPGWLNVGAWTLRHNRSGHLRCGSRQRGTRDEFLELGTPIAKIKILTEGSAEKVIGYTAVHELHPAIPQGTLVSRMGDDTLRLYDPNAKQAVNIQGPFTARLVKYDPTDDTELITIVSGKDVGKSGWIRGILVAEDDHLVDRFSNAWIYNNESV